MADGIRSMFDDAGSRVSAMSNALKRISNNVSGTLSATYEVNQTKEPAIINPLLVQMISEPLFRHFEYPK